MTFLPPGTVPFPAVLARLAETWTPERWNAAPARETAVLLGEELHTFQRGTALRAGSIAAETYGRLRPMLVEGQLPALLHVKVGSPRPIPPASWLGNGAGDLGALLAGHVGFMLDDGSIERGAVLVAEVALSALIEGRPTPAVDAVTRARAPSLPGKGGNRPRPDADHFWIEVCRHLKDGTVPGNVTAFAAVMVEWAEAEMRQPYDIETVRKKIGLMFRTIGWDGV